MNENLWAGWTRKKMAIATMAMTAGTTRFRILSAVITHDLYSRPWISS
jgi:hypothetical protein